MWRQTSIVLRPRPRGFHLITDEVVAGVPELSLCQVGLLHLWLQHTSASLTINENADGAVRRDFERFSIGWCRKASRATSTTTRGRTICQRISSRACSVAS